MAKMRIYFTTDIHGSEVCFKKFINAASFYKADVIILGGDITGKAIIPITEKADGTFQCRFLGETITVNKGKTLEELTQKIRNVGFYPYITSQAEVEELLSNEKRMSELFTDLSIKELRRWLEFAEKRLKGTKTKCFISPGNDDIPIIDQVLNSSECIVNPNEKVVTIDDDIEMLSLGYSNITPWKCPRDITDDELYRKINQLTSAIKKPDKAIFNIHTPPHDSGIDLAPELDANMRPKLEPGGRVKMVPVGSKAVKDAILKHQPLLGLHGHIHESKGFTKIGRTLCLNPGSEYQEGILRGALIQLSDGKIKDFLFVAG
ncbi:MAG: metallophosphoesterase [Candidatus Bathyarchaeota archaeon]|nr:metallophosphoesterase [Candidatus Bathyarchaeota archaeon]MCX8178115.1 metallophosphoesterase [Candidatus Bathyarchaeota archaeon]MDW8194489.1 metallophosphoesterase [Nitrososphaerota archaeon]